MVKYIVLLIVVSSVGIGGFFYGRKTAPPVIQTQEIIKVDKQIETITETITLPSGETKTITKIVEVQKTVITKNDIKNQKWKALIGRGQSKQDIIVGIDFKLTKNLSLGSVVLIESVNKATPYITLGYSW